MAKEFHVHESPRSDEGSACVCASLPRPFTCEPVFSELYVLLSLSCHLDLIIALVSCLCLLFLCYGRFELYHCFTYGNEIAVLARPLRCEPHFPCWMDVWKLHRRQCVVRTWRVLWKKTYYKQTHVSPLFISAMINVPRCDEGLPTAVCAWATQTILRGTCERHALL